MSRSTRFFPGRSLLACALFVSAACAHASDDAYSDTYATCVDTAGGVTADTIACIGDELGGQDARLNKLYKELGATLTPERRNELKQVQRDWLRFRDGNCRFYADPDGGTLARVSANECVLRTTTQRADELQNMLPME